MASITSGTNTSKVAVLEAAVQCYIKIGYANTIVTRIAEEAELSRGAMMYHFDGVRSIIIASVGYLMEKRIEEYQSLMLSAEKEANGEITEKSLEMTINALWKFLHSPYHIAYQELIVAARSDPDIAKADSLLRRSGLSPATDNSIAAVFGPTPKRLRNFGAWF